MQLFSAAAQEQVRLYLDESGTLGFGDEVFTMAMVRVHDLPKLEACIARNKTTQAEIKASQMKTAQKLSLANTILNQNGLQIYLLTIDPAAASACERKLDKELLYDSMIAQAMAYYLERGELPRGLPYRLSLDMRGGIRESFEDMVCESIGNVLMHRADPLVSGLDIRYMDSKYSAGVQVADLFSNIYRTALAQKDSPCNDFLRKGRADGIVHVGFSFGLPELAAQMSQIAADLRARVEYDVANNIVSTFRTLPTGAEATREEPAVIGEQTQAAAANGGDTPAAPSGEKAQKSGSAADAGMAPAVQEAPLAQAAQQEPARGDAAASPNKTATGEAGAGDVDAGKAGTGNDGAAAESDVGANAGEEATEAPRALSRSARRRRSRAARKAADAPQGDAGANADTGTDAQPQEPTADDETPATESAAMPPEQAEPSAEPAALTARERRQKAAKKTARGTAKHPRKAAADQAQEAVSQDEPTQDDAAQPADTQPPSIPEAAPTEAAQPEKPKRTRTRGRSKAKSAPATVEETAVGMQTDVDASPKPEQDAPVPDAAPSDGANPAKPKPRRTRTRKAAAQPAESAPTTATAE